MYYDDFYEPSKFDMMVDEWKETLRKSIKAEYQDRVKELENKIAELEEFEKNKAEYERQLAENKRNIEKALRDAKQEAYTMRLDDLLANIDTSAWKVSWKYEYKYEKCDKCDDKRRIHFSSPSGKDVTEDCSCSERVYISYPEEVRCITFYTKNRKCREKGFATFVQTREEAEGWNGKWERTEYGDNYAHILYKNEPFESVERHKHCLYFLDKEKCQEFCDWLNKEHW